MVYGIIFLVAVIALTVRHARYERASLRSKRTVIGITTASSLIYFLMPSWVLVAVLLQAGTCVYIILHQIVAEELARPEDS